MKTPLQPTFFDGQRTFLEDALDTTALSLMSFGSSYEHWAIAFSGGKDSSATVKKNVSAN